MAAESSWSLRGVDPRARDIARAAAKREGITIGEWLNRQLLEDLEGQASHEGGERQHPGSYEDPEVVGEVVDRLSRRIEAAEHRSTLAITNIGDSVSSLVSRLDGAQEQQAAFTERYGAALEDLHATQRALHSRIERMERQGADTASLAQLKALEEALGKLAARAADTEAESRTRVDALKSEIERSTKRNGDRLDAVSRAVDERLAQVERRIETDASSAAEAAARRFGSDLDAATKRLDRDVRVAREESGRIRRDVETLINERAAAGRAQIEAIEGAVANVQTRLMAAERETDKAIKGLERSFAKLDSRIRRTDTSSETISKALAAEREAVAAQIERRFEGFSRDLADMVSETRAEIAQRMVEVARQEGPAAVAGRLGELGRRLGDAERRQKQTLARISEEVAKLAGAVEGRVRKTEAETAQRLAEMTTALAAAQESPAAQAAELTRLQARLKAAEGRSGAAVDAVTRRVDALDERLPDRAADPEDMARRIRESEERTRGMITGALADVSRRLDHSDDQIASALSPVQRALDALKVRLEALEDGRPAETKSAAPAAPAREARAQSAEEEIDFADPAAFGLLDLDMDVSGASDLGFDFDADPFAPEPAPEPQRAGPWRRNDAAPGEPEAALEQEFDPELDAELRALESADEFALDIDEAGAATPAAAPASSSRPRADEPGRAQADDSDLFADDAGEELELDLNFDAAEPEAPSHIENDPGDFDLVTSRPVADDESQQLTSRALVPVADHDAGGDADKDDLEFDPFADDDPDTAPPADFLESARRAARKAAEEAERRPGDPRASAGFGPAEAPVQRSRKGRGLLVAAGGLAFLAVGAAGVIVLRDSARERSPGERSPANPLEGLFSTPTAGDVLTPKPPAAPGGAAVVERSINVDLADVPRSGGAGRDAAAPVDDAAAADEAAPETSPAEPAPGAAPAEAEAPLDPSLAPLDTAAAAGDGRAQHELGEILLERGENARGLALVEAAAAQGVPGALYRVGKLYEAGGGVAADAEAAVRYLEQAAEAGHRNAMHSVGILYAEGRGASQDFEAAARWFEEAAMLGSTDAQYNLAVLYEQGLGVPASLPDAYAWFTIAARSGDEDAGRRAQSVAERLAPQARERADEAARRFSPNPIDPAANGVYDDAPWAQAEARVARVQLALSTLGYLSGPADGVMGEQTAAAIRAYQTDNNLPETGEADAALLEKLEADVGSL